MPTVSATNNGAAGALFQSAVQAAAVDISHLSPLGQLQLAVAQLFTSDPTTINIPAGDILSGTFGANKAGGADVGTYVFPAAATVTGLLTATGGITVPNGKTIQCGVSTTAGASLNLGNAGTAPTSPNDGDVWIASNAIKVRLNGSTVTITTS